MISSFALEVLNARLLMKPHSDSLQSSFLLAELLSLYINPMTLVPCPVLMTKLVLGWMCSSRCTGSSKVGLAHSPGRVSEWGTPNSVVHLLRNPWPICMRAHCHQCAGHGCDFKTGLQKPMGDITVPMSMFYMAYDPYLQLTTCLFNLHYYLTVCLHANLQKNSFWGYSFCTKMQTNW